MLWSMLNSVPFFFRGLFGRPLYQLRWVDSQPQLMPGVVVSAPHLQRRRLRLLQFFLVAI